MNKRANSAMYGIGTDIIEVARVNRSVSRESGFRERVFTANEIAYCEQTAQKALHYAARFAAKEAFLKAMGTGWAGPLQFHEIELTNNPEGKPAIVLHGKTKAYVEAQGITAIHVSMSHVKEMASAIVVLQTDRAEKEIAIFSTFVDVENIRQFLQGPEQGE
ncbi:MAG: holo-ACP synthase [Bacteroidota bacterium]